MRKLEEYLQIIIWGAGNLGRALGKELLDRGLPLTCYWDLRSNLIKECNSLSVYEPFSHIDHMGDTLIIFGASSGLIQSATIDKLSAFGCDYIQGMKVYQELLCPNSLQNFDINECCKRIECNVDTCSKLNSLIYDKYYCPEKILLETAYLFITQRCSLKCKYCIAYMNSYEPNDRKEYDIERILCDIDAVSEACAYIKRVVVYGGEPFLHPNILNIVDRLKEKNNVGIIDIVTNGIFTQPDEVIAKLGGDNVRIEYSNYEEALNEKQLNIRNSNFNRMKEMGLEPFMHSITPEWIKPRTFYYKDWDDKEKERLKTNCDYFVRNSNNRIKQSMVIANGIIYPCRMACSIKTLGVADYKNDYIVIDDEQDLVGAIDRLYGKQFYNTCGHCESKQGEITQIAGEQGFDERYRLS